HGLAQTLYELAVLQRSLALHRADEFVHACQLAPHRIEAFPDGIAMEGELTRARFRSSAELLGGHRHDAGHRGPHGVHGHEPDDKYDDHDDEFHAVHSAGGV